MTLMMLMVDLIPSNSLVLRHPILHNHCIIRVHRWEAVRKMTLSDPWMEGDDFQPGLSGIATVTQRPGDPAALCAQVVGGYLSALADFDGNVTRPGDAGDGPGSSH
jgi:hypothetical protein